MTEPTGYEYVLESTQSRNTSVVVRGAGHLCTLIQKTPLGVSVVDLSEGAKAALVGLLMPPPAMIYEGTDEEMRKIIEAHTKMVRAENNMDFIHNQTYADVANALPEQQKLRDGLSKLYGIIREEAAKPEKRKPGRPPKAA